MSTRSPRAILALSTALALTAAALAPTAAFAKGPGPGAGDCDGDCVADPPKVQQPVRARDGSGSATQPRSRARDGSGTQSQANVGGGQQVQARAGSGGDVDRRNTATVTGGRNADRGAADRAANRQGRNAKQGAGQGPNEDGQRGPGTCEECTAEMGTLTDEQANDLVFMANEEKLAHDVYLALAERYGLPIFENIAASEARHQEAVSTVLERYGIEDSAIGLPAGEFSDPAIRSLYEELIARGSASLEEAIAVGVLIEETDIADLESRLTGLEESAPDVHETYSNLLAASRNHLAAFAGWQ